jgi:hypothetical protein
VLEPALEARPETDYEVLIARHGYASIKHASNAMITAKRRFSQCLRDFLIAHTPGLPDEAALDREIASLGDSLAGAHHFEADPPSALKLRDS